MIEYFGKLIRPLVLIMPKINEYAKTLKVKNRDRDKHNKLMPFCTDDEMLLGKYKAIWTKIEDFKNFELNALTVYDRCIKTKIRTYSDKVYTNFFDLNVPGDNMECKISTVISDFLLVYQSKYYLQVYLDNCAYRIIDKQMIDYLDENLFED